MRSAGQERFVPDGTHSQYASGDDAREGTANMNGMPHRLAAAAVLAVSALAGCGGGDGTNGLEQKPAAEVQQAAAAALKGATSVHVVSAGTIDGKPAQIDLRIQGRSSIGTMELAGTSFQITKIGEDVYLKGSQQALDVLGMPADAQRLATDRWLRLGAEQVTTLEGFSLDDLAAELTDPDSPLEPAVEQTTLDGRKVVVISQQNGSKLYVANTGPAYPLRGIMLGDVPGQLDFTEYGASFDITAPPDAVDYDYDAPSAERRWLESIGTVRKDIDETYRIVGSDYDESEIALLAHTLGSCRRELAASEPPSARMQPVYDLVERACQEFDKGAECFATAVKNWNLPAGTAGDSVGDSLECGLAAQTTGGKLLTDAEIEGYKLAAPR